MAQGGKGSADSAQAVSKRAEYRVTEHLKPYQWQKGQSGNPGGAYASPRNILQRELKKRRKPGGTTQEEDFWRICLQRALKGEEFFVKLMAERLMPAKQVIDATVTEREAPKIPTSDERNLAAAQILAEAGIDAKDRNAAAQLTKFIDDAMRESEGAPKQ